MACVRRHPKSKYYSAFWRDSDGKLRCKTTKLTDRTKALKVAQAWEKVFRAKNAVEHIRTAFNLLAREIDPEAAIPTVKEYFDRWLEGHGGELADRTRESYALRLKQFAEHAGHELTMDAVKQSHALSFRCRISDTASAVTANTAMRVMRSVFGCAMNEGVIVGNPFKLTPLAEDGTEKQAFNLQQVQRLMSVAKPEWRSLITFGIFTGQRLGDLVTLTWSQIDFDRKEILFKTEKTSRRMAIPANEALWSHILTLPRGTPAAPLHPHAFEVKASFGIGLVSREFTDLMVEAGLAVAKPRKRKRDKKGDVSREVNPLTFHSLRHAAATWLRDAGVSESLAREIVGHDSAAVDRGYVHTNPQAMREALNRLPIIS